MEQKSEQKSSFSIENRMNFCIDGVEDILSFDEMQLVIKTVLGKLCLDGEGLHISVLSLNEGKLILNGRIDGVYYLSDEDGKGRRQRRKG